MPETSLNPQKQSHSNVHKPFVIEIRQDRPKTGGSFVPAASLKLQEEFRTSGLLHFLSPEDLKSLLFLLTFITPEGHCTVSLPILTSSMKVPSHKAKSRMHRLAGVRWQNEPLIIEVPHESGLVTYGLHPRLVAYEHLTVSEQHSTPPFHDVSRQHLASRNRIVSYSRRQYSRPRAEVERIVAGQLGQDMDESDEQRKLRYRLENAGLTGEQAKETIQSFEADVIARQLDWLPFRHAKNPAGYLLAAIEGDYSEPRGVHAERIVLEQRHAAGQAKERDGEQNTDLPDGVDALDGDDESHGLEGDAEPLISREKWEFLPHVSESEKMPDETLPDETSPDQTSLDKISLNDSAPMGSDIPTLKADDGTIDLMSQP